MNHENEPIKNETSQANEKTDINNEPLNEGTSKKAELSLHKDFGADVDLLMTIVPDKMGFKIGDFPNSEDYYKRAISLPMYPSLSRKDQDFVIKCVKDCFQ